jgi:transformation/transcription domain-associated protein
MEVFKAVQTKLVPHTVVLDTFTRTHSSFASFWLFQRQFSYQLAALTFMTYVMHMNGRYPHKMSISRATGNVWGSELIPALASGRPMFYNPEAVPFRLTPNLQTLMGPLATEGIFSAAIMAIARCLTMPEYDLAAILSIFVRDEMIFWFTQNPRSTSQEGQVREIVDLNTDIIAKKAVSLAECPVGDLPANQTVIDLIARAVNPYQLAQSDILWMPYL